MCRETYTLWHFCKNGDRDMIRKGLKEKRIITVVLMLVMVCSLGLVGCGEGQTDVEENNGTIQVTDMMGRDISLDKPAEKVVVLDAANCEVLYALGAEGAILARGEYCNYPEAVLDIPMVGSGRNTNIENIIALQPDIVIANSMDQTKEQIHAIEAAGIPVVMTDDSNIEGVYTGIMLVGEVMGKSEEAIKLVDDMKADFESIAKKAEQAKTEAGDATKTVYIEASPLEYGLWASGSETFAHEIVEMLGAKNIFDDVENWVEVSQEQVISRNPDLIISTTMFFGGDMSPEEEIYSRKGWEGITAIKEKQVFNANSDTITRPGPRLVDAAYEMYEYIYGESVE